MKILEGVGGGGVGRKGTVEARCSDYQNVRLCRIFNTTRIGKFTRWDTVIFWAMTHGGQNDHPKHLAESRPNGSYYIPRRE